MTENNQGIAAKRIQSVGSRVKSSFFQQIQRFVFVVNACVVHTYSMEQNEAPMQLPVRSRRGARQCCPLAARGGPWRPAVATVLSFPISLEGDDF